MLGNSRNRLSELLQSGKSSREMIEELYWASLSRAPQAAELKRAIDLLDAKRETEARRMVLEDLAWALLNSKEFVLRR